jgi:Cu(I)-responsive transcriptional regulator
MSTSLNIGDLARATSTKSETIRYYEKTGLLKAPPRSSGNYRRYGPEDVSRLGFVRRARELGFSIEQVRSLLALAEQRQRDCCTVDLITDQHLAEIEGKIADLVRLKEQLTTLRASCAGGVVADCRILDGLFPSESSGEFR